MPGYRIISYRRYHDTFVSEFFLQLANVVEVSRGRSQHQQRFKEESALLLCTLAQSFGGTIGSVAGSVASVGVGYLGQREEDKRAALLTPEYLSGQWQNLQETVNTVAENAVGRYRHYLETCSEADATELGRVSAQRLWEYLSRTGQSFSIDNMLVGILKGKSGFLQDGWFNTPLSKSKHTAEGLLKRSSIVYRDEETNFRYTSHPKNKDKYGFMVLSHEEAQARITEKKHISISLSPERALELQTLWDDDLKGDIVADSTLLSREYQSKLNKLEQDWCSVETWQKAVDEKLEHLTEQTEQIKEVVTTIQDVSIAHAIRLDFLEQRYVSASTTNIGWSYFAYPRDTSFQKRPQLWSKLEARFATSVSTPVVLSGLGGSGKTSLASEWAHAQKESNQYSNVRWLAMDTFQQFGSVEQWAKELGLPHKEKTLTELWAMIAKHLSTESWLIVLDNVPHYEDIKDGLAQFTLTAQQRILITTRDATSWSYPIAVDVYSEEEALSYIELQMAAVGHSGFEITTAKNLAQHLSYHPLALELAMAQICLNLLSLKAYQKRLEAQELALNHSPTMQSQARLSAHQTVSALWQDCLPSLSEDALAMLRFLSFLDAQGGAQDVLLACFEDDEARLNQAVRMLRQQSLIKHVDLENGNESIGAWSVHRLLQDAVREKLVQDFAEEPTKWEAFLTQSWEVIKQAFPTDIASAQDISAIRRGVSHGYAFLKYMETIAKRWPAETSKSFLLPWQADILLRVGAGEQKLVQYAVAIESLNKALMTYREAFGESSNHSDIALTLNCLGGVYQGQGDIVRAVKLNEESLVMYRIVYASTPNHSGIAMALHNLGLAYKAQGDTTRAIKLYEDSLAMKRIVNANTPNHPDIAETLNSLGSAYRAQGDNARAIRQYEEALLIKRIVYASMPNHPSIANTLNCLGNAYQDQGDNAQAIKFYEESLMMKRIVYARTPNHPEIAVTLSNLGTVYEAQGDNVQAIKLYEDSLAMKRIVYASTPNHSGIAITLNNLGNAYKAQGDTARAIKFYEDSLAMSRIVYASTLNHPNIATKLNSLGNAYQAQGDNARAIKLYEEALLIKRIAYASTPNHPEIAGILNNLGNTYRAQGDTPQAIRLFKESLEMYRIVYNSTPNHPRIAIILQNLILILSVAYLGQHKGSFFHANRRHKISELQAALSSNSNQSPAQLTELVRQATKDNAELSNYFASSMS